MTEEWDKLWKEADISSINEESNLSWQWVRNILFRIKGEGDKLKEKAEKWDELGVSIEKARTQKPPQWYLDFCEVSEHKKILEDT